MNWSPKSSLGPHPKINEGVGNWEMSVKLLMEVQSYWPQLMVVGHHDELHMIIVLNQYVIHQTCGWLKDELICLLDHLWWC